MRPIACHRVISAGLSVRNVLNSLKNQWLVRAKFVGRLIFTRWRVLLRPIYFRDLYFSMELKFFGIFN